MLRALLSTLASIMCFAIVGDTLVIVYCLVTHCLLLWRKRLLMVLKNVFQADTQSKVLMWGYNYYNYTRRMVSDLRDSQKSMKSFTQDYLVNHIDQLLTSCHENMVSIVMKQSVTVTGSTIL